MHDCSHTHTHTHTQNTTLIVRQAKQTDPTGHRAQWRTDLASLLRTTGGSCCGSPTSTNLSALKRGPRHAGCSTCDASSTMHTSNLRRVNTGWLMPRQLVATMPWKKMMRWLQCTRCSHSTQHVDGIAQQRPKTMMRKAVIHADLAGLSAKMVFTMPSKRLTHKVNHQWSIFTHYLHVAHFNHDAYVVSEGKVKASVTWRVATEVLRTIIIIIIIAQ